MLYYSGLSYRVVATALRSWQISPMNPSASGSGRLKEAFPKPERKRRKRVAVDETKLKLSGKQLFAWAAVDVKSKEVLACRFSWQRKLMQAEAFLRRVLETCSNKPLISVDRGPWYPDALRSLNLKWKHVTFGLRNRIHENIKKFKLSLNRGQK
ncbi:IS6 family transposase [Candidatus Bathyarchaeota archaeon A05DMB-2]|nr:IS6 family transposase [Candidatus Bathyarchaeota archaeon A05DMB-2]